MGAVQGDQNGAFVERSRLPKPSAAPEGARTLFQQRVTNKDGTQTLISAVAVTNLENKARITRPFEEDGWFHACVKIKGAAVASVPPQVWVGNPGVDKSAKLLPDGDPLMKLFRRPMPFMTSAQFFEASAHHRAVDGEDFWFLLDKNGLPVQAAVKIPVPTWICPVRGNAVTMNVDPTTGWPKTWRAARWGSGFLESPVQSVIQFRDYNIDDPLRGLGDGEALDSDIQMTWQATRYQSAVLRNSGDPGGFIVTDNSLNVDESEAIENEAKEAFGVQNAGRWKVLSGKGITYTPNKLGPRDMDFAKLHPWHRDKILAVFGIPPPIVGVMDYATLANFVECVRMFWQGGNGVLTYLRAVEDVITNLFLRDLDHKDAANLYFKFDTSGVEALHADRAAQIELAIKIAGGNLGVNFIEACAIVGIDVDAGVLKYAQEHFIMTTVTTVDAAIELANNPPEPAPAAAPANDAGKVAPVVERDDASNASPADASPPPAPEAPPEPDPAIAAAAERRAYWQTKSEAILEAGEAELRSKYRSFSKEYERGQFKRLRDFAAEGHDALRHVDARAAGKVEWREGDPPFPFDPNELESLLLPKGPEASRLARKFKDPIKGIWANALEDIADELDLSLPLLPADPSVISAIESQILALTDSHINTLGERVRAVLIEELSKATNLSSLQAAVDQVLPELTDNLARVFGDRGTRATLIARDQTANAMNRARNMEMVHAGVSEQEWITQHDAAVRGTPGGPWEDSEFSHFELDGKKWGVSHHVDSANHPGLKYPKDPDGQAGDVIGCRCMSRPIVKRNEANQ